MIAVWIFSRSIGDILSRVDHNPCEASLGAEGVRRINAEVLPEAVASCQNAVETIARVISEWIIGVIDAVAVDVCWLNKLIISDCDGGGAITNAHCTTRWDGCTCDCDVEVSRSSRRFVAIVDHIHERAGFGITCSESDAGHRRNGVVCTCNSAAIRQSERQRQRLISVAEACEHNFSLTAILCDLCWRDRNCDVWLTDCLADHNGAHLGAVL